MTHKNRPILFLQSYHRFSSFLVLSPTIGVSSFANSAVPFLNCIRTAPHRTPRILPQKKFIPRCFCWIQLKRNYICDKNISHYHLPMTVACIRCVECFHCNPILKWECFQNIIQNKIYGIFWATIILEAVLSMRACRSLLLKIYRWVFNP